MRNAASWLASACLVAFIVGASLFAGCSQATAQSRVLSAASAALEAICEDQPIPDLCNQALAVLKDGDVAAAVAYLKADIVNNGYDKEVAALLSLIESQLVESVPFRDLPETEK